MALTADFTGRYTFTQYTDVVPAGIVDGQNYTFTLPEDVFTPYTTLSGITFYVTASGFNN